MDDPVVIGMAARILVLDAYVAEGAEKKGTPVESKKISELKKIFVSSRK